MAGQESLLPMVVTNDYLGYLYPLMRIEREAIDGAVEARDMAERALDDGAFPLLSQREANVQVYTPQCAEWLRWVDPETGEPRTVKTPARGRVRPTEADREETLFDLQQDVQSARGDRINLRKRIRAFYFRFRERPPDLPGWLWSLEDHLDMQRRIPGGLWRDDAPPAPEQ